MLVRFRKRVNHSPLYVPGTSRMFYSMSGIYLEYLKVLARVTTVQICTI